MTAGASPAAAGSWRPSSPPRSSLIALPTGFFAIRAALEQGNRLALVGLLFPVVGAGLLVAAVRATWRERKFGVSVLELATTPGVALGLTLFAGLWGGIVWLLLSLEAGPFFVGVFGLVEMVLVYAVLRMWLRVVEVTAGRDGVAIASGFVGVGDPKTVAAADITGVDVAIGMQAGTTVYYALMVVRKDGRRVSAGSGIRDKREAEWLAGLVRQAVGLTSPAQR